MSYTALHFIRLYSIIITATCFSPICRAILRLIFEQVECTIDTAFNLRDLVLQELVKIIVVCYKKNLRLKFRCIFIQ
jgi:hypothetical protein